MMLSKEILEKYDKWVSRLPVGVTVSTLRLMKDRVSLELEFTDKGIGWNSIRQLETNGWKIVSLNCSGTPSIIMEAKLKHKPKVRRKSRKTSKHSYKRWDKHEDSLLWAKYKAGVPYKKIAKEMERSTSSLYVRIHDMKKQKK